MLILCQKNQCLMNISCLGFFLYQVQKIHNLNIFFPPSSNSVNLFSVLQCSSEPRLNGSAPALLPVLPTQINCVLMAGMGTRGRTAGTRP